MLEYSTNSAGTSIDEIFQLSLYEHTETFYITLLALKTREIPVVTVADEGIVS